QNKMATAQITANPFDQSFQSEQPGGPTTANPFDSPFTGESAKSAPQGVGGFVQGVLDNTVRPVADLAGRTKDYIANELTPQGQAEDQQQDAALQDFKRRTYAEAGQHLKNGDYRAAAGSLLSLLSDSPPDPKDPVWQTVNNLIDAHKEQAKLAVKNY